LSENRSFHGGMTLGILLASSEVAMEGIVVIRHRLTDEQWDCFSDIFPFAAPTGRPRRDRRKHMPLISAN
jgi:hypothetical protein